MEQLFNSTDPEKRREAIKQEEIYFQYAAKHFAIPDYEMESMAGKIEEGHRRLVKLQVEQSCDEFSKI